MKNKQNKQGVTLVEVIVAMTILGVIGTMLSGAYISANKARAATAKRVTEENQQATDIEEFNYKQGSVDFEGENLEQMSQDPYKMTFDFGSVKIEHDSYGFTSTSTELSESGFALKFFTPSLNKIKLESGEYWLTINSSSTEAMDTIILQTTNTSMSFFVDGDEDKEPAGDLQTDGTYIYYLDVPGGSSVSFGVKEGDSVNYRIYSGPSPVNDTLSLSSLTPTKVSSDGGSFVQVYFDGSDISVDAPDE